MEDIQKDVSELRDYLENLTDLFRDISNKIYRLEAEIRLLSREQSVEDSRPQKRVRFEGSGVWEE
jgi:hypothetical protein